MAAYVALLENCVCTINILLDGYITDWILDSSCVFGLSYGLMQILQRLIHFTHQIRYICTVGQQEYRQDFQRGLRSVYSRKREHAQCPRVVWGHKV